MNPFKLLSWSIILTLPLVAFGLMIGYFGSSHQGPNISSASQSGSLLLSILAPFNIVSVAQAQDNEDGTDDSIDISVGQTVFPNGPLLPSQPVVYSLFITNNSSISLSGIIVSNIVPPEIVSTTIVNTENGSKIVQLTGYPTYSWQIDNLDANTRADIYVLGRLAAGLNRSTSMENKLEAALEEDVEPANNTSTIQSQVKVPVISFAAEELLYTEMPTKVNVSINLDPVNPYGSAQVDYGTSNGLSASSVGTQPDFETVSGTVLFEAAVQRQNSISVTLYDDKIDEDNESFQLFLSNPRGAALSQSNQVTITIEDDDVAGLAFSPPLLSLTEGGDAGQYSLMLETQPTASVVVSLDSSSQILASPSALTFTSSTWDLPQVVDVIAIDDIAAEGLHNSAIGHRVTSTDQKYNALDVFEVTAGIVDNDRASFKVSTAQLTITEGVTGVDTNTTYSITLDAEPTQMVTVSIEVDSPISVEPSSLQFRPDNWDQAQLVTITTLDDSEITESVGPIRHRIISNDPAYSKASIGDVILTYVDNDHPGVNLTAANPLQTLEGHTLTYELSLNTAPEAQVTIALNVDDTQVSVEPKFITLDETNWNQPQQISVTPIDDDVVEGVHNSMLEHDLQSVDRSYDELLSIQLVLQIIDDDTLLYIPYVQGK